MIRLNVASIPSPLGRLFFAVREGAVCALDFEERWPEHARRLERRFGAAPWSEGREASSRVAERLLAYLAGSANALDELAVDAGGTPFQARVWAELRRIPAGATKSYGAIARAIGAPAAVRAVGAANGQNPIALVVPCHRLIGSDGTLTGYAGGLERKRWLLAHEARWAEGGKDGGASAVRADSIATRSSGTRSHSS